MGERGRSGASFVCSLSLLLLVACSSSGSGSSNGDGNGGSSGAGGGAIGSCKPTNACNLVTQADITAALGSPVAAGDWQDYSNSEVLGGRCTWNSSSTPAKSRANVFIRCYDPGDNDPKTVHDTLTTLYKNVVDVPGVGDTAYWGSGDGIGTGGVNGQLDVLIGKTKYFIVDVGDMPDDATAQAAAKKIAMAVVPQF
jgi:hypothetical protein